MRQEVVCSTVTSNLPNVFSNHGNVRRFCTPDGPEVMPPPAFASVVSFGRASGRLSHNPNISFGAACFKMLLQIYYFSQIQPISTCSCRTREDAAGFQATKLPHVHELGIGRSIQRWERTVSSSLSEARIRYYSVPEVRCY